LPSLVPCRRGKDAAVGSAEAEIAFRVAKFGEGEVLGDLDPSDGDGVEENAEARGKVVAPPAPAL